MTALFVSASLTRFKAKCYRHLYELRQKGVAFILVNHNSQSILNICDTATISLEET